jgi:hypothetical protein
VGMPELRQSMWEPRSQVDRVPHARLPRGSSAQMPLNPNRLPRGRLLLQLALVVSVVGTLGLGAYCTPSIGNDPLQGIVASRQALVGKSSTITAYVTVDPRDLITAKVHPITYWPPSYQAVPYELMRMGFSLGSALRVMTLTCWIVGIAGWALYFRMVLRSRALVLATAVVLICLRSSPEHFYSYVGGDLFVWTVFPYLFVATRYGCSPRPSGSRLVAAAVAGTGLTLMLALKYSAALLVVGCGTGIVWLWISGQSRTRNVVAFGLGVTVGACNLCASGFSQLIRGGIPGTPGVCKYSLLHIALFAYGGPTLGLTGYDLSVGHVQNALSQVRTIAPPLMVATAVQSAYLAFLAVALDRRCWYGRFESATVKLALMTAATVGLGIGFIMVRGGCASFEGRHFRYVSLLLLPYVVGLLGAAARSPNRLARVGAWALATAVLILPAIHGVLSLVDKTVVRNNRESGWVTPSGVRSAGFAGSESATTAINDVRARLGASDVLLVWNLAVAMEFPEYDVVLMPTDTDELRGIRFPAALPRTVRMILPSQFAGDTEYTRVLRNCFPGPVVWVEESVPGSSALRVVTVRSATKSGSNILSAAAAGANAVGVG